MLGILHNQFKEYVEHTFGKEVYRSLLIRTGCTKTYSAPQRVYANRELERLTRALAMMLSEPFDLTQERFVTSVFPRVQEKFALAQTTPIETVTNAIPTLNLLFCSSSNDDRAILTARCPNEATAVVEYTSAARIEGMVRGMVKMLTSHSTSVGRAVTLTELPRHQPEFYAVMVQLPHHAHYHGHIRSKYIPYNPLIMKALRQQHPHNI